MTTPLDGYKTYLITALVVGLGVFLYLRGDLSAQALLQLVGPMLGLSAVRHGMARK